MKEKLGMDKPAVIRLAMAVIISAIIAVLIFTQAGVGQGDYNADSTRWEQGMTTMGSQVADHDTDISSLRDRADDYEDSIDGLQGVVATLTGNISLQGGGIESLEDRVDSAEGSIVGLAQGLAGMNTTMGSIASDIVTLEEALTVLDVIVAGNMDSLADLGLNFTALGLDVMANAANITGLTGNVTTLTGVVGSHTGHLDLLDDDVEALANNVTAIHGELETIGSPPEAYLTGNLAAGNLTVHAEASYNGTYATNIHLVFDPAVTVGNATTYSEAVANWTATVNWSHADVKLYIPVATYNGTAWVITQVWWSTGTFDLVADTEKDISILFGGLADTPDHAYVEIYPVLK